MKNFAARLGAADQIRAAREWADEDSNYRHDRDWETFSMRKSTYTLLVSSSLWIAIGCSADPDSLGTKGDNQGRGDGQCEGPNPSTLGCEGGCPTGMVCDPEACHPSACGCDQETGYWTCTADCSSGGACVAERPPPACEGPDPAVGCGSGCPSGMICDRSACQPSSCECDPGGGGWICTDDCGSGGSCVADEGQEVCRGPNPSLGCDAGCPSGTVCDPNACRSSHCGCDRATGFWQCTADCGSGGACVPEPPDATCEGRNPSLGCDGGCPSGTVCDPNACRSSACGCDRETGFWRCTADCGSGGNCVPASSP